nr:hypothetical protein Iba_chr12fCG22240 [Ipomoea batatas]
MKTLELTRTELRNSPKLSVRMRRVSSGKKARVLEMGFWGKKSQKKKKMATKTKTKSRRQCTRGEFQLAAQPKKKNRRFRKLEKLVHPFTSHLN